MRTFLSVLSGILAAATLLACSVQFVNPPHELTEDGGRVVLAERRVDVLPCT